MQESNLIVTTVMKLFWTESNILDKSSCFFGLFFLIANRFQLKYVIHIMNMQKNWKLLDFLWDYPGMDGLMDSVIYFP